MGGGVMSYDASCVLTDDRRDHRSALPFSLARRVPGGCAGQSANVRDTEYRAVYMGYSG